MRDTALETHVSIILSNLLAGHGNHISVDKFKIILEIFTEAIVQMDHLDDCAPGNAHLVNARNVITEFYEYQDCNITSVAIEMFNDRLVGNLRNDKRGLLSHSQYQPKKLIHYAIEVMSWGLVVGLVLISENTVLH